MYVFAKSLCNFMQLYTRDFRIKNFVTWRNSTRVVKRASV